MQITDAEGNVWDVRGNVRVLVQPGPAAAAAIVTNRAAATAEADARAAFSARCKVLAEKAKLHAEAPGSNPNLTTREMNEAIARLFKIAANLVNMP